MQQQHLISDDRISTNHNDCIFGLESRVTNNGSFTLPENETQTQIQNEQDVQNEHLHATHFLSASVSVLVSGSVNGLFTLSHTENDTENDAQNDKNGFYYNMQSTSHCTETDNNTDCH